MHEQLHEMHMHERVTRSLAGSVLCSRDEVAERVETRYRTRLASIGSRPCRALRSRNERGGNDSPFASARFRTFNDSIDDEEVIAFEAYRGTDYPRVSGSPSGALGDFPGR